MENESDHAHTAETEKKNLNPLVIGIAVILVLGVILAPRLLGNKDSNQAVLTPTKTTETTSESELPEISSSETVKEFIVEGGDFKFSPNTFSVNKGDTVKVVFRNVEGMHDFVLEGFNVKTNVVEAGNSETVTFTADKVGEFEFYCSVGTHRKMGMTGTLSVK